MVAADERIDEIKNFLRLIYMDGENRRVAKIAILFSYEAVMRSCNANN
jgi:hypothetical protein